MATKQPLPFHPVLPVCKECEQAVRLERIGVTAEGQMEVLGTCPADHLVRVEMHFAELVAKAAVSELHHGTQFPIHLTPFAEVVHA